MLVFVLAGTSVGLYKSMVGFSNLAAPKKQKTDLVKLQNKYKTDAKNILDAYFQNQDKLSVEQAKSARGQLLALIVPGKYKELHYNLVFSLDNMIDYLMNGDSSKKEISQKIMNESKEKYSWLN